MNFYQLSKNNIEAYLKDRLSLSQLLLQIEKAAKTGVVAIYPCSRHANFIAEHVCKTNPSLTKKLHGFYNSLALATTHAPLQLHPLSEFKKYQSEISLLIIASDAYLEKLTNEVYKNSTYSGPLIRTSAFDLLLPEQSFISSSEILEKIENVYNQFADSKSKMVYMMHWLSRALNDPNILDVFEQDSKHTLPDPLSQILHYKHYQLEGIDPICIRELYAELYNTEHVYIAPGDVVFDVGAYKGDTSVYFADCTGKNGKVYAFEPTTPSFEVLRRNIERNSLGEVIIPIKHACSNQTGTGRFGVVSSETGVPWAFLSERSETKNIETITTITIDDFVAQQKLDHVDFIKMDVEGFEANVLEGAKKTIQNLKPKLAIALYHKTSDLVDLPLFIDQLGDYKMYCRSKMEGPFSLTLYCLPKKSHPSSAA